MSQTKLSEDWAEFRSGLFAASNNVWNKGGLQNGSGYTQTISIDTARFPNATKLAWSWPDAFKPEIYAYPELVVGDKAWSNYGITALTSKVTDLREFRVDYDLAIGGQTGNFNVAFSLWLTDKAKGTAADITTEVMIWVHAGDLTPAGSPTGKYDGAGFDATVYSNPGHGDASGQNGNKWDYVALRSPQDDLKGSIDVRDVLLDLRSKGIISGSEYVMGYELGAEVAAGSGSLTVGGLSHKFGKFRITGGNDTLLGTATRDVIDGRGGNDAIKGAGGRDELRGGDGRDRLSGGAGADKLWGGKGGDTFLFADKLSTGGSRDAIKDFSLAQRDRIGLEDALFSGVLRADKSGHLAAGQFQDLGKGKAGAADRILYDKAKGDLYFDKDGSGAKGADPVLFAHLDAVKGNHASLDASDFLVL